jgi:hypothetical protein
LLSLGFAWACGLSANTAYLSGLADPAVQPRLSAPEPRPEADGVRRYFLPGSSGTLGQPRFKKLMAGWEMKNLKGAVYDTASPTTAAAARQVLKALQEEDERAGAFLELDLRSAWEREELKGKVRRRVDRYPGPQRATSEVLYDRLGRRTQESLFNSLHEAVLSRRYAYSGDGPTPTQVIQGEINGTAAASVSISLGAKGLPLEEEQKDSQGLPLLRRSYRYDIRGKLVEFKEYKGIKLRPLRFEFSYDDFARLAERRVSPPNPLEPQWVTSFNYAEDGSLAGRAESFDNLPLPRLATFGSQDPRKALKYRWRFSPGLATLHYRPYDGPGNEAFPDYSRRLKLNPGGWLEEDELLDKDGFSLSREFWAWNPQGFLLSHEVWADEMAEAPEAGVRYDYKMDAKGNWIRRRAFGESEAWERSFEYFED